MRRMNLTSSFAPVTSRTSSNSHNCSHLRDIASLTGCARVNVPNYAGSMSTCKLWEAAPTGAKSSSHQTTALSRLALPQNRTTAPAGKSLSIIPNAHFLSPYFSYCHSLYLNCMFHSADWSQCIPRVFCVHCILCRSDFAFSRVLFFFSYYCTCLNVAL